MHRACPRQVTKRTRRQALHGMCGGAGLRSKEVGHKGEQRRSGARPWGACAGSRRSDGRQAGGGKRGSPAEGLRLAAAAPRSWNAPAWLSAVACRSWHPVPHAALPPGIQSFLTSAAALQPAPSAVSCARRRSSAGWRGGAVAFAARHAEPWVAGRLAARRAEPMCSVWGHACGSPCRGVLGRAQPGVVAWGEGHGNTWRSTAAQGGA